MAAEAAGVLFLWQSLAAALCIISAALKINIHPRHEVYKIQISKFMLHVMRSLLSLFVFLVAVFMC